MRILRFVPLLLALLVAAPIPTAAWKLRKKQQHASTSTDDDSGSTSSDMTRPRTRPVRAPHNVTITQVENGVVVNATLPSECLPVEQRCLDDELTPLVDMAHNDTASADEKNVALQSFCTSECGQNYTGHVAAILQGYCMTALPPRLSNEGAPYYGSDTGVGVVVVNTPRANVSVGEGGVRVRVGPRRRHGNNDHDDHDNDDHDNEHDKDENEEDDEDEHGPLRSPEEQQAYNQRQWDKFSKDRPGSPLGCMVAHDGEYCAAKAGCDFFNSCCYASWTRLAGAGGYMLSTRSIRNIEFLCPGSLRFLGVDGCT